MNNDRLKKIIDKASLECNRVKLLDETVDAIAAAIVRAGHWIPYCECGEHDSCSNDTSLKTTHEMVCVHCGSSRRGIIHGEPKPKETK